MKKLEIPNEDFEASHRWLPCFMNWHGLSIRKHTSVWPLFLDAYEEKLLVFQWHVIQLWEENNFIIGQIVTVDQTSLYFAVPVDTTINEVADQTGHVCFCSYEKQQ